MDQYRMSAKRNVQIPFVCHQVNVLIHVVGWRSFNKLPRFLVGLSNEVIKHRSEPVLDLTFNQGNLCQSWTWRQDSWRTQIPENIQ